MITDTARRAGPYACNGVTTSFAFSFKVFADADLRVVKKTSAGLESDLALTTDFTVTRNADQEASPGGTITTLTAYATGNTLTLLSQLAYTQTADITNAGGFFPDVVENALDRMTILAQQLKEIYNRIVVAPASDSNPVMTLPVKALRANAYLTFDSNGDATTSAGTATQTISSPMVPVVTAASLATARSQLGVVTAGLVTASELTMTTGKILGRNTTGTGAPEELTPAAPLKISSGAIALRNQRAGSFHNVGISTQFGILGVAGVITVTGADGTAISSTEKALACFRSPTSASGVATERTITTSPSVGLTSTALVGTVSGQSYRLWLALIDATPLGGGVELAIYNARSGVNILPFNEESTITTVAMDAAADSAGVWYSTTARANVAFTVIGYIEGVQATAGTWLDDATKIVVNPKLRPGDVVQTQISQDGTLASGSTVIPLDNTIPQKTEGDQYMSQAITPTFAGNLLDIEHDGQYGNSGNANMTAALFQDTTTDALKAVGINIATCSQRLSLKHRMLAGTGSSTTFKIRGGPTAGTCYFNGATGGTQLYGTAVCASHLKITEIFA